MEESGVAVCNTLSKGNFGEICRCCLSPNPFDSILELKYEETPLVNVFYSLFATQVDPKDDLPQKICETCIAEVIRCYNFKKRYEASDAVLRNIITVKAEDLDAEIEIKSEPLEDNFDELDQLNIKMITELKENESCHNTEENIEQKVNIKKRIFTCSCEETFKSKLEFRQHREFKKHQLPRTHSCKICGKLFSERGLLKHEKSHEIVKSSVSKPVKTFVCDECGRLCHSQAAYKLHLYKHGLGEGQVIGDDQHQCEICRKFYFSRASLLSHMVLHNKKKFLCNECGKEFHTKSSLQSHALIHTHEKTLPCEFCDRKFARQESLRKHRFVHTGETPYACPLCPKKFRQNGNLNTHMRTHTGEKPYVCELCDKSFPRKNTLSRHVLIHTGEKPFKCDKCASIFRQSASLNRHLKIHTGEKHKQLV